MKTRSAVMTGFALVFILLGTVWLVTIYRRCVTIVPQTRLVPSLREMLRPDRPEAAPEQPRETFKKFRSPHAKWHYFTLFWVIAVLELIVAILFILAGLAVGRRYRKGARWVLAALLGDLVYKFLVGFYMYSHALPLAGLIRKPVSLVAYYMPDKNLFSGFSSFFSGIGFYPPQGNIINGIIYLVVLGACWVYFLRKDVQAFFPDVRLPAALSSETGRGDETAAAGKRR